MKPTYEELEAKLRQALERIAELEEKLNLNSKNSSKPPSTDQKGSKKSRKKNGAKIEHPGHFRPMFSHKDIDKYVDLMTEKCPKCAGSIRLTGKYTPHQQVEIAEKPFIVTQYNRKQYYCPCCKKYGHAALPKEIGLSAFGTRLSSLMGFLTGVCRLSRRLSLEVVKQGFGVNACVGTQSNIEKRVSESLKPSYREIERSVREEKIPKHVDETGWSKWGEREYVWVMSTRKAALYKIQKGRGAADRDALLGNARKRSVFITDRLALYNFSSHQYCLAHLKRDLKKFSQRKALDGCWGEVMGDYLQKIFQLHREYKKGERSVRSFRYSSKRYRDEFEYGLAVASLKDRHSKSLKRFAANLLRKSEKLWVFVKKEGVDPTNNQAERDLRGMVIWRKTSYGSKSERGDRFAERIQSVATTLKRSKEGCLEYLVGAFAAWKTQTQPLPVLTP